MSITSVSCGDDKDEPEPEPIIEYSVEGVWKSYFNEGYSLLTLEKNGTFSLVVFDDVSGTHHLTGTYSVEDKILTLIYSDGDVEVYTILTLTQKKMITRYEGSYLGQYPELYEVEVNDWTRVE